MTNRIIQGDCIAGLKTLPDASVHCCVTSPPYWGLRDYGHEGQIGLEETPEAYVARMAEVFREVRRVLRDDGTLWLNLGDSYAGSWGNQGRKETRGTQRPINGPMMQRLKSQPVHEIDCCLDEDCACAAGDKNGDIYPDKKTRTGSWVNDHPTLKPKDLVGIPWRVAFALQADGWWLRQDIIWHKPNPMPESVRDRCTKAHEYVFLLTKSERYFYDAEAVKVPASQATFDRNKHGFNGAFKGQFRGTPGEERFQDGRPIDAPQFAADGKANRRSVWTVSTKPYKGAHFATMPTTLVEPCIKAGTSEHGCCGRCGAPYERETKRTKLTRKRPNDYTKRQGDEGTGNHCANSVAGVAVETVGWRPTCKCNDARVVPCVVLDPFAGSGTTLAVAAELGRVGVGCELNPEYIKLAEERIAKVKAKAPLFA